MSTTLQQKLSNEILIHYPTAQVKKLGADNFVDIHLPFVHDKRGTHLFFNTSGVKIKLGFYCRDEEFTSRVLSSSSELEAYAQGVRLAGNPAYNSVEDAVKAAQVLVSALGAPTTADQGTPIRQAAESDVTILANLMVRLLNSPEYKWLRPEGVKEVSGDGSSVRLHVCTVSGIFRQFQVRDKMIHAEYYFNPERIDVYNQLVRALNADEHHVFANGIYGNGPSKGSSRTIKLTLDQGAKLVGQKGEQLAKEAIEAFIALIDYIEPWMPDELKGWSQRHTGAAPAKAEQPKTPPPAAAEPAPVDQEEDDERGYPMLRVKKSDVVAFDVVKTYIQRWQQPSKQYAGRLGIQVHYPDWVEEFTTDAICPAFTTEQMGVIEAWIRQNKMIPILEYAPEEMLDHVKAVWWIVPFAVCRSQFVSYLFVDKDGIHGLFDSGDGPEIMSLMGWDSVDSMSYEYPYDDGDCEDPNVARLTLETEDGSGEFDEFVSPAAEQNRGSYLSILYAIWEIRKKTIEASKGQPVWLEGSGGEEFVRMESSKDISDEGSMYYRVGITYYKADNFAKAAPFLRKSTEQSHDFKRLKKLASCLVKMEEFDEAIGVFKRAEEINEDDIYLTRELARLVIQVNDDFKQACDILTEGIEKFKSKSSEVEHYDLLISERGLVHKFLEQPELSIADLEWSKSINSEHQKIWRLTQLGEAYTIVNQYDKAIECLLEAIEADSDIDEDRYILLGHAYFLSKNYDSAIQAYETAIKSGSSDAFMIYRLSHAYNTLKKNYDRVLECVEIGLKSAPAYKWLYREKAIALDALGRHGEAATAAQEGLSKDPSATEFYYQIGRCHRLSGNHLEAISNLQKAIEVNANHDWAYYHLGLSQISLNRHHDALSSLKKALEIDPNWVTALNDIGSTLMLLGEVDEAIEYFNRSLQIDEKQKRVAYQRGMAFHKKMMFDEAIENYKNAEHNWIRDLDYFYNREVAKRQIPDVATNEKDVLGSDRKELVLIALKNRAEKEWYRDGGAWDTEESIRFADDFIAFDPTNVEAYLLKIKLLMKFDSDSSTIRKLIEKCLNLEPSNTVALNLRGRMGVDEHTVESDLIPMEQHPEMVNDVVSVPDLGISEIQFESSQQAIEFVRRLQSENNADEIKKITVGLRDKQVKEGSISVAEAFVLLSLQGMELAGKVISVVLRDVVYTLKDIELGIEYEGDEYTVKCSGVSTETVTLEYILDDSEENQEKICNNLFNLIQIDSMIKVSDLVSSDYDTDLSDYEFFGNTLEVYEEDGSLVLDSKLISDIWDFVKADDLLSAADYDEFTVKVPGEVSIK